VLIARSLERVGDNAVGIAAQTGFLVADDVHGLATAPRTLSA
jgi:phosphate uptake regulator